MDEFQNHLSELASLFGYKYDDLFFEYLKSISIPNTTTCGKEIKLGDGGWKCKDCELESCSVYCNDCFIKEKHLGHDIYFSPNASGFCDCGVPIVLKPEGFCDKHKGDYDNMRDLMDFIKSSINEKVLERVNEIFNKIIFLLLGKIKDLESERIKEEERVKQKLVGFEESKKNTDYEKDEKNSQKRVVKVRGDEGFLRPTARSKRNLGNKDDNLEKFENDEYSKFKEIVFKIKLNQEEYKAFLKEKKNKGNISPYLFK